jgi:hypothetical protein
MRTIFSFLIRLFLKKLFTIPVPCPEGHGKGSQRKSGWAPTLCIFCWWHTGYHIRELLQKHEIYFGLKTYGTVRDSLVFYIQNTGGDSTHQQKLWAVWEIFWHFYTNSYNILGAILSNRQKYRYRLWDKKNLTYEK